MTVKTGATATAISTPFKVGTLVREAFQKIIQLSNLALTPHLFLILNIFKIWYEKYINFGIYFEKNNLQEYFSLEYFCQK